MVDDRVTRLVFDARTARKLLKMGFVVVDIKPNRENTDKSIFIFENTDKFRKALKKLKRLETEANETVEG